MTQQIELKQKSERSLVTPIDQFQAATFDSGVFTSGHIASGLTLTQVASPVKLRPLNLELYNSEPGWIELSLKDGKIDGAHVLGPYRIQSFSEKRLERDALIGRFFTSSICTAFVAGYTAQPLSTGVRITLKIVYGVERSGIPDTIWLNEAAALATMGIQKSAFALRDLLVSPNHCHCWKYQ